MNMFWEGVLGGATGAIIAILWILLRNRLLP